jgi:hypothetical protein
MFRSFRFVQVTVLECGLALSRDRDRVIVGRFTQVASPLEKHNPENSLTEHNVVKEAKIDAISTEETFFTLFYFIDCGNPIERCVHQVLLSTSSPEGDCPACAATTSIHKFPAVLLGRRASMAS